MHLRHLRHQDPVLSNYCPIIPLLMLTRSPCGVACEVTSKKVSGGDPDQARSGGGIKAAESPCVKSKSANTGLINMSQEDVGEG